ncbi:hypothetical protein Tco_1279076 [Tanacetum coccineum]
MRYTKAAIIGSGMEWSYEFNLKAMPKEESNDEQKNSPLSSPFYQQPTHKDSSPSSLSDKNSVDVFRLLKSKEMVDSERYAKALPPHEYWCPK